MFDFALIVTRRVLAALVIATSLAACGGGGGSTPASGANAAAPDAGLSAAVAGYLENPELAAENLGRYAVEVRRVLTSAPDLATGMETVKATLRDALASEYAIQQLSKTPAHLGHVISLRQLHAQFDSESGLRARDEALCPDAEDEPSLVVYYVNGINTNDLQATDTLEFLKEQFGAQYPALASDTEFRSFINPSGTAHPNRLCRALAMGAYTSTYQLTRRHDLAAESFLASTNACGFTSDLLESFGQLLDEWGSNVGVAEGVLDYASLVQQDVLSGKRVVLVAHSQGNMFASQIASQLPVDILDSVGVMGLASPVPHVHKGSYGRFSRLTIRGDIILGTPGAPTWTAENEQFEILEDVDPGFVDGFLSLDGDHPGWGPALSTHEIDKAYLASPLTRNWILRELAASSAELVNSREAAGQGVLQATLSWDQAGDIDLHATEPDGSHVYFATRSGTSGTLDRDDRSGTGPENYFVCSHTALRRGVYKIGVTNYRGEAGTRATIRIRAGTQSIERTVVLGESTSSSTADLHVATVEYFGSGRFEIR